MKPAREKILMHICCAPCSAYPLTVLEKEPVDVFGFFFNPNIHPYQEYERRRDTLVRYADLRNLRLIVRDQYDVVQFIRDVVYREEDRCRTCYFMRLEAAARTAKKGRFDFFTSTLLYSKHQKHDLIREMGEGLARRYGVQFLYRDFREGWKEGIRLSKEANLYRQQYCGCIYSEQDRFRPAPKKGADRQVRAPGGGDLS
jgi:epoxyqueuosine reductase